MHGAPWGTMNGWLRFEVEERGQRYGHVHRPDREPYPPVTVTEPEPHPIPALDLAKDDVAVCA